MSEEKAFLDAIRCNPDDDVTRLVYADWLDEQGDGLSLTKSAYIRLECLLSEVRAGSDEFADLQTRRHELTKRLKPAWVAVVSKVAVDNCGIEFKVECPQRWDLLRQTRNGRVRFCEVCKRNVYYCQNISDAREKARFGLCVALDPRIARRDDDLQVREIRMGRLFPPRSYPPLEE